MIAAVHVQAGQTLSSIASQHGVSLGALEGANPSIANPNLIYVGQSVVVPSGGSFTSWSSTVQAGRPSYSAPSGSANGGSTSARTSSAGVGSGGIDDIPGVPSSFVSCVAFRESTNGTNAAYNGGDYGIIRASGINVNGQSLSAQKAAFKAIYDSTGGSAWAADGCPGT